MTDLDRRHPRMRHLVVVVVVVVLAACSGSDDGGATSTTQPVAPVVIALEGPAELPLGEPLELTVTLSNSGERSVSVPVDFTLVAPDGTSVPFYRTSLFVPFGDSVSESIEVTTSRWYADTGDFAIEAGSSDPAIPARAGSHVFSVGPTERFVPRFEDVTAQAGVLTEVPAADCGQFSNGAAWGDVDGDGWQDLVVTRLDDPVQLFRSDADSTFTDESVARGITGGGANGAAFADYDNDGDPDLMLVGDGPDRLLRNDGNGYFDDVTDTAGIAGDPASRGMSAAWGDYDGDGLLDLYVANYMECTGPWTTAGEIIENVAYHPDVLYHNEGDGTFRDTTAALPDRDAFGAAFAAAWLDIDGDGRLDLYVGNDFVGISPDHNRLWHNDGPGDTAGTWRFSDVSLESGAGLYMNTMGIGVGDVERDGDLDLALSNIGGNKLLRSEGDSTFVEDRTSGIERPNQGIDYTTITWGSAFYDFDLDGWEDLFMAAGNLPQSPEVQIGDQPNMLFLNDGSGTRMLDVSALTGADDVDESKGVAFADYDNDGAIDMFVVNQDGSPRLYRNVTPRADRHWIEVDLVGSVSNRDGCGALVTVVVAGESILRQVLCGSGGSGSASQREVHVGLGDATAVDRIEVQWPSGTHQVVDTVAVDQMLTIEEPE